MSWPHVLRPDGANPGAPSVTLFTHTGLNGTSNSIDRLAGWQADGQDWVEKKRGTSILGILFSDLIFTGLIRFLLQILILEPDALYSFFKIPLTEPLNGLLMSEDSHRAWMGVYYSICVHSGVVCI